MTASAAIPGESADAPVTVEALVAAAREVLEGVFVHLWVRGEVSDFKRHRSGHWYFTLRDKQAQLRCVVWARDQQGIPAAPDDGMQIVARGRLTVFAARGEMQFTITAMEADGDGLWQKALERTRKRLNADGLLSPLRKRPLPKYPQRIAVITSPDGAALRDIIAVARRRSPLVEIVVVPARVQGEGAAAELRAALARVARWNACDLVIIGRGGGGREDLWAFNDERLARAVAACPVPTISAVGHEVDISICDLVADVRAATPSAAAEAAVPLLRDQRTALASRYAELRTGLERRVGAAGRDLTRTRHDLGARLSRVIERRGAAVRECAAQLHGLSPLATLGRGFALARDATGHTLASVADFRPEARFELLVRDGAVWADVDRVVPRAASGGVP